MPGAAEVMTLSVMWLVVLRLVPLLAGSTRQRTGALVFLSITLAATTSGQGARRALDAMSGVPDLSILLGHLFAMLAVIFALEFTASVTEAEGIRLRSVRVGQVALTVAMACMTVMFVQIPRRSDRPDFGLWQAQAGTVISYQLLFQACLGIGLSVAIMLFFPHWRSAAHGPLKAALLLLWVGAATGLGYVASRVWYILTHGIGVSTAIEGPIYGAVTFLLLQTALTLLGVGAAVPVVFRLGRYVRRLLSYHRLRRLWSTLTRAVPDIVLVPPSSFVLDLLTVRSLQLRLYRRVVEIRDAQLELSGYVCGEIREAAQAALRSSRQGTEHRELALDACILLLALRIKRQGVLRPAVQSDVVQSGMCWTSDPALDGEVARLLALERLMRAPQVTDAATKALVVAQPA